jgi:UDP-3-O-[3-hydroxymyristoyl] N-acetylglucosamine deacetylase
MTRRTIAREVSADGIALHAGTVVRMTLRPAGAGAGIVFRRADLGAVIPARYDLVGETQLGTVLVSGAARVGVIEHLMAAIVGCGIDDLEVELDGPEPPILDGSALGYLELLERAGKQLQGGERTAFVVRTRVEAMQKGAVATLEPFEKQVFDFEIDFQSTVIGCQRFSFAFGEAEFRRDIAPARTFGFVKDLETLHKLGLGRGASLDNTLAIDEGHVVNADAMRFSDEFVRHKILDAIGDLALAGAPLIGRFSGKRSGHALNNALLRALFADSANFQRIAVS